MIKSKIFLLFSVMFIFHSGIFAQIDFEDYQIIEFNANADIVVVDDINGDGLDDVVTATGTSWKSNDYKLMIWYQSQDGLLETPILFNYYDNYNYKAESVATGFLNNDQLKDIVIANHDSITVFYQISESEFNRVAYYSGNSTEGIATGDLNNDGRDDIAVSHFFGTTLNVFYQDENGSLFPVSYEGSDSEYSQLEIADINEDNLNDLIFLTSGYSNDLYFFIQNEEGTLEAPVEYLIDDFFIDGMDLGYLNDDDKIDLALSTPGNEDVYLIILYNDESSDFFEDPVFIESHDMPMPIKICDLNCNGKNEIITAHGGWHSLTVHEQDENNSFTDEYLYFNNVYGNYSPYSMDYGDLNNDGKEDIAIVSNELIIFFNDSKPEISDTIIQYNVYVADTTINHFIDENRNVESFDDFDVITIDKYEIIETNIDAWSNDYYYGIRQGVICDEYVNDSVFLDSAYNHYLWFSSDTVSDTHIIDTLFYNIDRNYRITPNPNRGDFQFRVYGNTDRLDIEIYDLQGKLLYRKDDYYYGNLHINMVNVSRGMKLIIVKQKEKIIYSKKFIIY